VAVVSDADLPLEKTAGPEVGAMIRDLHQSKGVTFHFNRRVVRWDGHAATLDDGSRVEGDLLVAGVGATPRTELAEAAGLTLAAKEAGAGCRSMPAYVPLTRPSMRSATSPACPILGWAIRSASSIGWSHSAWANGSPGI
jgi:hypothetical protein